MKVALPLVLLVILATSTVPAFAAKNSSASGYFNDTEVLYSRVTLSGSNVVFDQTNAGIIKGTFSGQYVAHVHLTVDPTGDAVYQALDVCTCTVGGKSGTLYFYEQGTITKFVLLSSTATIVGGTDQLAKLQGNIELQGIVYDPLLGLTMGTYAGQIWHGSAGD